jgi:hypothetical protein
MLRNFRPILPRTLVERGGGGGGGEMVGGVVLYSCWGINIRNLFPSPTPSSVPVADTLPNFAQLCTAAECSAVAVMSPANQKSSLCDVAANQSSLLCCTESETAVLSSPKQQGIRR